jgi:phosphotransferase system HPr-like phosphotransfer protein
MRTKILLNKFEDISKFVKIANTYESDINVYKGHYIIDGKSLLGLMSLNLAEIIEVEINSKHELDIDSFHASMRQFEVEV